MRPERSSRVLLAPDIFVIPVRFLGEAVSEFSPCLMEALGEGWLLRGLAGGVGFVCVKFFFAPLIALPAVEGFFAGDTLVTGAVRIVPGDASSVGSL